jgi:cytochrome c oxidase cbb3-type subunit 3
MEPMHPEKDRLLESHQDNDGIREYDNPLPDWFLFMFLGTIVFSCLYCAYWYGHGWAVSRAAGVGQALGSSGARFHAAVRRAEAEAGGHRTAEPTGEALVAFLKSPASISKGEAVYKSQCVACHGDQGEGVVGPNLVDPYWIHGGKAEALLKSIGDGYPDKGMPAWKPVLGPEKVRLAAAYVMSLRGRPVQGGKAPQGEKEE